MYSTEILSDSFLGSNHQRPSFKPCYEKCATTGDNVIIYDIYTKNLVPRLLSLISNTRTVKTRFRYHDWWIVCKFPIPSENDFVFDERTKWPLLVLMRIPLWHCWRKLWVFLPKMRGIRVCLTSGSILGGIFIGCFWTISVRVHEMPILDFLLVSFFMLMSDGICICFE